MTAMRLVVRVGLITASVVASAGAQAPATAWKSSGTVDFGFVSATGNTDVTTITLGEKLTGTRGVWTVSQFLANVYGKTKGVESANQLRIGGRAERKLDKYYGAF